MSQGKLTIVLNLKDRSPFTYRWIRYMNDMRCPYKILIADGGKDEAVEADLRRPENYPHLNYEYIRYPYDSTLDVFLAKLESITSRVQTEYLLQADNDDFYLLERIPELLEFLDRHPDHVGARGQLVNFEVFDAAGQRNGLTEGSRYKAIGNDAPSIDSDDAMLRIETLCRDMSKYDYYANWYCVFRAPAFQEIWKNLVTLHVKEIIVLEILSHVMIAKKGKIRITPAPFYLRQSNTSEFGDTLVVGNEFLERCMVNNAFSEFAVAIDRFVPVDSPDERDRILKAIASWLEIFVSNIYHNRSRSVGVTARLRRGVKTLPYFGPVLERCYIGCSHLLAPMRRRRVLRFKSVEPYFITSGSKS